MRYALPAIIPLVLLTAACSGSPSPSAATVTSTVTSTATATTTVTATASPTSSPSPTGSSSTRCSTGTLVVTLGTSDGTAGSVYQPIVFTNKGSAACTLAGHPGVSFVAPSSGAQVGAAAVHTTPPVTTVTLKPGGAASALLRTVDYGNYSASACVAHAVSGLRVYPPGSTSSVVVALPSGSKACSTKVPQLSVGSVVKGSTGQ